MLKLHQFYKYYNKFCYNSLSDTDKNHKKMTSLKTFEDEDRESSYGVVFAVSGPGLYLITYIWFLSVFTLFYSVLFCI